MFGPRHASWALNLVRTASQLGSSGIGATTSDPASATTFHGDFWNGERIMLHCYTKTPNKLFHGIHTHSSHCLNSRIDCESPRNHKGLMCQLDFSHHIVEARICKHHIDLGLRPKWFHQSMKILGKDIPQQTLKIMRTLEFWMLDLLDVYKFYARFQMWKLSSHTTILQHFRIVHNVPRYGDVLPIVGSWTFETIVHMYNPKALRIMLVLQALHHLDCKLKDLGNPGTIEMLGKFSETLDHFFK